MADKFLIQAFDKNSGLINVVKPFMIPDKAYARMNNAYVWRDRVRKRFGSRYLGLTQESTRLRVDVGTTDGVGAAAGNVPGVKFEIGQMFSIDNDLFTVWQAAGALKSTNPLAAGTFDTVTGAFTFAGASPLSAIYWYPSDPVMGLITFERTTINDEQTIAFDTQFSYFYNTIIGGWERIIAETNAGDAIWTGDNSQFFWGYNYSSTDPSVTVLYVTNFNELEPNYMRYLTNVAGTLTWTTFRPTISVSPPIDIFLYSARILVLFHNTLIAFNTWEYEDDGVTPVLKHYPQRARWCELFADPTDQTVTWRDDIDGFGDARDASTQEAIITVEFIRDRLIVYFERSTWEFVWTGNVIDPFIWQQINTEYGAESTFSVVPFDTVALGVGNVGIMACSGTNVTRIDDNIPDEVFNIHNNDQGIERVYGIRDYFTEMVWWTFPDSTASADFPFPKKVLVYNYKNGTWAFNDDSITAFGHIDEVNFIEYPSKFNFVIAGNQQGWTFIIDSNWPTNAEVLQITNIVNAGGNLLTITSINHNLNDGDYVFLEGITSDGNLNLLNQTIQQVIRPGSTPDTFQIQATRVPPFPPLVGTYTGGGAMARVSKIDILTKAYNFYQKQGRNAAVNKIDFLVDRTNAGKILVDWFLSTNTRNMVADSVATGVLLGTSVLETTPYALVPFENAATQLWHSIYISAQGEYIQLSLYLSDDEMRNIFVRESDFQLHGMCFTAQPTGRLQ